MVRRRIGGFWGRVPPLLISGRAPWYFIGFGSEGRY